MPRRSAPSVTVNRVPSPAIKMRKARRAIGVSIWSCRSAPRKTLKVEMRMRSAALFAVLSLFLGACATTRTVDTTPRKVVESYLASLTRRDLLALTAYTTIDVEWYTIVGG